MGIFDFVKDVGEKLGLTNNDDAEVAKTIQQNVENYDLGVEGLTVEVQGDKATISGNAASAEAVEKAILAAGNTQGIAQVETLIATAEAAPDPTFYTVKSGDTLSKVSKEFYGNANLYNKIFEANRPMLSHPDKIYPGQSLRIPSDETSSAVA